MAPLESGKPFPYCWLRRKLLCTPVIDCQDLNLTKTDRILPDWAFLPRREFAPAAIIPAFAMRRGHAWGSSPGEPASPSWIGYRICRMDTKVAIHGPGPTLAAGRERPVLASHKRVMEA